MLDKIKGWWRVHNDATCRDCGYGYKEAIDLIKESEHYKRRAYELADAEGKALDQVHRLESITVSQRELLVMVEKHLVLLRRLAQSSGPIKNAEGKIESKYKVIAMECEAAYQRIQTFLKEETR